MIIIFKSALVNQLENILEKKTEKFIKMTGYKINMKKPIVSQCTTNRKYNGSNDLFEM